MDTIIALTGEKQTRKTSCLHTLAFLLCKVSPSKSVCHLGKTGKNWSSITKEIDVAIRLPNGKTVAITTRGDSKDDIEDSYKKVKKHSSIVDLWVTASHQAYTVIFEKVKECAENEGISFWTEARIANDKTVVCYERGRQLDTRIWAIPLIAKSQKELESTKADENVLIDDGNGNQVRVYKSNLVVAQELFSLVLSRLGYPISGVLYGCVSVVNKI